MKVSPDLVGGIEREILASKSAADISGIGALPKFSGGAREKYSPGFVRELLRDQYYPSSATGGNEETHTSSDVEQV